MKMYGYYRHICIFFISVVIISLAGCSSSTSKAASEPKPIALIIPADELDPAWDEIVEVLREHYFIPDRQDRRTGIIITRPTVSQQWFEFWRDDAQGWYQWAESSLHTMRRIVEVHFMKAGKDKIEIKVKVHVQRKNQPQRQITTSSGVIQAFRDTIPIYTGATPKSSKIVQWTDIGEDKLLEKYLLELIHRRLTDAESVYPQG